MRDERKRLGGSKIGKRNYVLAFDSGTQSVKTIIFDVKGNVITEGRVPHKVNTEVPGRAEQNPREWWTAFCTSIKLALINHKDLLNRLSVIGITHQRCTLCAVDEFGEPLLPAQVWYDSRAVDEVRWIKKEFGAEKYMRIAGRMPDTTWWAQKAMWIRNKNRGIFEKTYRLLTVHGYFVHKLTGEFKDSYAAPTGLLDMAKLEYSEELLEAFGIPRNKLSDLVAPGEIIGQVSKKASEETGLPEGLPVAAGAGDQQAGGLGCGVINKETGYLNLGTSVVLGVFSPNYIFHPNFFVREGLLSETWNLEALINSGYWMVTWFKENFAQIENQIANLTRFSSESLLELEASKISPGSNGLIVQPYWLGVRQPYWDENAKGTIIGWNGNHTRSHLFRAIIEGIAYDIRLNLEGIESTRKSRIRKLLVHGGGSRSDLSCQIISDVCNMPIHRVHTQEATTLGAAILAAKAVGIYPDIPAAVQNMVRVADRFEPSEINNQVYTSLFKVYKRLYPAVQSLMKGLNIQR